ncbi:hypothetical protein RIR_jg32137.t1 [Rhizophagus irregularis DAOM 181602=DAOM 197198]|nr:hypothetical protein RIR_jg32137.t1 [Rhizophagus irregularis DAOM 181602=DAOM 197198]
MDSYGRVDSIVIEKPIVNIILYFLGKDVFGVTRELLFVFVIKGDEEGEGDKGMIEGWCIIILVCSQ